ncbi:methyltransferase domain-containing protein [Bradyrhizobium manausense]|uniref:methyltransferase domain-containing protein n=1 Tax=Bradyrhizobium manausense TaxID=989370 RepID=UPI001BAD8C41|nr:class I SAM-dependent methyltransferase [Bradyrhizobium manausense]
MSGLSHWQLDGSAPELYERYLVPAITAKWAADLVERAGIRPEEKVLDVACGTGIVARLASLRTGSGHVTGLDLNQGMLSVARKASGGDGAIEFIDGSALDLPFAAVTFDVVLCQLGLQFFPDQGMALREMRRVLLPGGRLAVSVYSPIERTPGAHAFVEALDRVLGSDASLIKRGEHSFGAPGELEELLFNAAFESVRVDTVVQGIAFPSVLDYVRFQLLATPMAGLLDGRPESERQALIDRVASEVADTSDPAMLAGGVFSFPQEAYVGTALAPG